MLHVSTHIFVANIEDLRILARSRTLLKKRSFDMLKLFNSAFRAVWLR